MLTKDEIKLRMRARELDVRYSTNEYTIKMGLAMIRAYALAIQRIDARSK